MIVGSTLGGAGIAEPSNMGVDASVAIESSGKYAAGSERTGEARSVQTSRARDVRALKGSFVSKADDCAPSPAVHTHMHMHMHMQT